MKKRVLITGITGQDGSYLARFLVGKGYEVYGLMRRVSTDPFARIEDLYIDGSIRLIYGNMRDLETIKNALKISKPDEIYNLAAQSHVGISFTCPEETMDINYKGLERLAMEAFKLNPKVRIYQASTSEMYGNTKPPQNEKSKFAPVSPYGESKLLAHEKVVVLFRKKGFFICSGILFNHESPKRGKHFVTRKISHSMVKIKFGLQENFHLGNLEAKRDWGFAGDYVVAMWLMLQQKKPQDFVIATGESHTVREFVDEVANYLGFPIVWKGEGLKEICVGQNGKIIISIDKKFYRPNEVNDLLGDSRNARKVLKWKPKVDFKGLIKLMVESDIKHIIGSTEHVHD